MNNIIKTETADHNKALNKALDYIIDVTKVQGRMLPIELLYGDGTRWLPLSRKGFEVVYNSVKETLSEQGYGLEAFVEKQEYKHYLELR